MIKAVLSQMLDRRYTNSSTSDFASYWTVPDAFLTTVDDICRLVEMVIRYVLPRSDIPYIYAVCTYYVLAGVSRCLTYV